MSNAAAALAEARLSGALDALRHSLERSESDRRVSERAMLDRLSVVETLARTVPASVAADAGGVSSAVAVGGGATASATAGFALRAPADPVAGLGVDWAAWTAGAEIDHAFTSWGVGRAPSALGVAARAASVVAAALPRYRAFVGVISPPPEVVLAADSAPASRCFAFDGEAGSMAILLLRPRRVRHVVIEQRPGWATPQPRSAPRRFAVHAWGAAEGSEAYSIAAGSFEYDPSGFATQAFELESTIGAVKAVRFAFETNWGGEYTIVCRLRAMAPPEAEDV